MTDLSHITAKKFWSNVAVHCDPSLCWPWVGPMRGGRNREYGGFYHEGEWHQAHRLAYEIHHGERLGKSIARHTCDNPSCCNPHHIIPGTASDNMRDAIERGRKRPTDQRGAANGNAKLTAAQVEEIRARIARGHTNTAIAKNYPVGQSMISKIRTGVMWRSRQDSNL